jgi:hypothetical protein
MKPPFEFFIVIAEHRSGSTLLTSCLSIQKNILFYSTAGLENKFSNFGKTLDYKMDCKKRSDWRKGNNGKLVIKLAHLVLSKEKGDKKLFGFKCHPYRIFAIPNYFEFLKTQNARIIFLTRNNVLLRYISRLTVSQKTRNSMSYYKNKRCIDIFKLNPINIEYNEYIKFKLKAEEEQKKGLFMINKYNLPYIHITYEEINENFDQCFDKIFDFLELDKNTIINCKEKDGIIAGHKKINVYKLQDKIINYEEFKKSAEDNNDIETLNFLKEGS